MVNRSAQKFGMDAIKRRLTGVVDPRGMTGILSRGKNVYRGFSQTPHGGTSSKMGRPLGARDMIPAKSIINRRLAKRGK